MSLLIAPAAAEAAKTHKVTAYAQRIYRIDLGEFRAIAAIPDAAVKADIAAIEAKLACAPQLPAAFTGQSPQVVTPISEEFGFVYANGAMRSYLTLVSATQARIAALRGNSPTAKTFRKVATAVHNFLVAAQGVDACADLQAWKAAGFSISSEPSATSQIARLIANRSTAGSLKRAVVWVTHSEYVRLKKAQARAQARYLQIEAEMRAALTKFFTAAGVTIS